MVKQSILKTVCLRKTSNWNVKEFYNPFEVASSFSFQRVGAALKRRKETMRVEDDKRYKRITIRTNCGGVVLRDEVFGKEIKTKAQYYVRTGQLAVSKIDARNGAFGIVPPEADGAIITGNFWVYDVDPQIANIYYLILLFSSKNFVKIWNDCSNGSGNRLYLQESKFLSHQVPMPSILEQEKLVKRYNKRMTDANVEEQKVTTIYTEAETYLFSALDISPLPSKILSPKLLKTASHKNMIGWGVQVNCNPIKPREIFHSNSYKNLPIERYCKLNPTTSIPNSIEEVSFIPMECVSDTFGEITKHRPGKAGGTKGYTKFKENDILWAKITPCMQNGKCALACNLKNEFGFGSTEFHVFRPNEMILPEFLYCFLRTKRLREVAMTYFTGSAGQQRVGSNFLEALTIPEIPITSEHPEDITQEKIVANIFERKREIKEAYLRMDYLRTEAKREFEGAVFGEA